MIEGSLQIFFQDVEFEFRSQESLTNWVRRTLSEEGVEMRFINIILCSDQYLLSLNQDYLNHDYYTDVITFQYENDPIEGEIFISLDRVRENAQQIEIAFETELYRIIIHGILHLAGYKDKTQEEKGLMREREDYYLKKIFGSHPNKY